MTEEVEQMLGLSSEAKEPRPKSPDAVPKERHLTAEELAKKFAADHEATNSEYDGMFLVISGQVERQSPHNNSVELLGIKKDFSSTGVSCFPQGEEFDEYLVHLREVTVMGQYSVDAFASHPQIKDCEVLEIGPIPGEKVTSKAFAEDVAKDAEAAKEKYSKPLKLVGKITKFDTSVGDVLLEGDENYPVRVVSTFRGEEYAKKYKVGDEVLATGVGFVSIDEPGLNSAYILGKTSELPPDVLE